MVEDRDSIAVEALIAGVQRAVARAGLSRSAGRCDIRVCSVQLTLRVVADQTAGAGFDFRVPFIGMKLRGGTRVTRKDTHTIDILLKPSGKPTGHTVRSRGIEVALVDAIDTIRRTMASAARGDDPWVLASGTVDIEFALTRRGVISLGADIKLANEVTHTLRLGLEPSSPG